MKCAVAVLILVSSLLSQPIPTRGTGLATPVAGESWLTHLGRSFDDTSMGKTGRLGPPAPESSDPPAAFQFAIRTTTAMPAVTLHGSDLYRLNCRGCHGELGLGAPPEINSVINPVRSSSAAAVLQRMKSAGMEMSRRDATTLAAQSHALLLERLHHGGQDMPAFPHLDESEVGSLVAYLKLLAEVPGAQNEQSVVTESPVRIGEHVVKSTCHICHSAAGPNPGPEQLAGGAIPPLNTLTSRVSEAQFVQKVTHGAPILMGTPPQLCRGRMPVFYYLSEQEAADVYLYLTKYPPADLTLVDSQATAALLAEKFDSGGPAPGAAEPSQQRPRTGGASTRDARASSESHLSFEAPLSMTAAFVLLLVGCGAAFTVLEIQRLSAKSGAPPLPAKRMCEPAETRSSPDKGKTRNELVA